MWTPGLHRLTPAQGPPCRCVICAYIRKQVFQVVVRGAFPLVLRELLHVAVQAEVQSGQLLLHLPHVLQLLKRADFSWKLEVTLSEKFFLFHSRKVNRL